ncbi:MULTISPECIES: hypothetical protein [unclassified Nostoc]|nr:hypothetical protein [Nostoc sp. 'Peltigera membranacea cyanobiont' 213]
MNNLFFGVPLIIKHDRNASIKQLLATQIAPKRLAIAFLTD